MENTFDFLFFTIQKNIENNKSRKQEQFSNNTISKIVFSVFLKTVIKNSFQKQDYKFTYLSYALVEKKG